MRAKYRFYKNKLALSPTKNRYENFVNSRKNQTQMLIWKF